MGLRVVDLRSGAVMSWYIAEVRRQDDNIEGYVIVDNVTGSIVRPVVGHPQSIFGKQAIKRIAAHLAATHGDPRNGEHTIGIAALNVLLTGIAE